MREIENQMERQNPAVIRHEKKVRSVFDGPTEQDVIVKENSEQLPDEQPERVYAELFEKLRESFFSIHKKMLHIKTAAAARKSAGCSCNFLSYGNFVSIR